MGAILFRMTIVTRIAAHPQSAEITQDTRRSNCGTLRVIARPHITKLLKKIRQELDRQTARVIETED
jgi:hypothetical protein